MQRTRSQDETEITYERYGDGQPLILLHGGMAPKEYWHDVIPSLNGYAAIVPQRPGFGTCLDTVDETSADEVLERETQYVRSLAKTVDGTPILFGHSYGGLTAIETAAMPTVNVEAVVAYEPAILPEQYRETADLSDRMQTLLEDGNRREAVKRYIETVLHPEGITDLDAWLAEWPVWPDCVELAEEVIRMNRAVEQYSLSDQLDVDVPVLVMTGTEGPEFLRESARVVHDTLETSRFVEFDGISHSGPAEAPDVIAAEVETFLRVC